MRSITLNLVNSTTIPHQVHLNIAPLTLQMQTNLFPVLESKIAGFSTDYPQSQSTLLAPSPSKEAAAHSVTFTVTLTTGAQGFRYPRQSLFCIFCSFKRSRGQNPGTAFGSHKLRLGTSVGLCQSTGLPLAALPNLMYFVGLPKNSLLLCM